MTTQLRYLTETLCSCTLSKDTFTQANVTCPSNNEPWSAVVSVWVQYASKDGLVTASDLISMIHNWLLDSTCACVAIEGSTLQLSRGCCTNGTNLQVSASCHHIVTGSKQISHSFQGYFCTIGSWNNRRICWRDSSYHLPRGMCHFEVRPHCMCNTYVVVL